MKPATTAVGAFVGTLAALGAATLVVSTAAMGTIRYTVQRRRVSLHWLVGLTPA